MFYISSGFGNGMFTLREHSLIHTNYGIKEDDRYIKNLARDYDKAVAKAEQHMLDYVGDRDKLELGKKWDLAKWGEADKPDRWEAPELTPEAVKSLSVLSLSLRTRTTLGSPPVRLRRLYAAAGAAIELIVSPTWFSRRC